MNITDYIRSSVISQINLFDIALPLNIFSIAATIFVAYYIYVRRNNPQATLPESIGILFPRHIYLHPSAKFDYFYFVASRFIKIPVFIAAGLASVAANDLTIRLLTDGFGPPHAVVPDGMGPRILVTILLALLIDLVYWYAHWLMHRYPWLWEYHKGHHSAEVMTPFTVTREHPVEEILFTFAVLTSIGIALGIFSYLSGGHTRQLELWGSNIIIVFFNTFISNLRHSHIWIPVPGFLARIIQSPAHHQIHHSTQLRHYGKNLGFYFSIWDWVFGTLHIPGERENETITFGIGEESSAYNKIGPFMLLPFKSTLSRIKLSMARQKQPGSPT